MIRKLHVRMSAVLAVCLGLTFPGFAGDKDHDETEGGIIGTGITGVVTAVGNVSVNGENVWIPAGLAAKAAANLMPGHVVAMKVTPHNAEWRAVTLKQVFALVGPLERDSYNNWSVLGSILFGLDDSGLEPGDWVAVSGLWNRDGVTVSRVDHVEPGIAQVSGSYLGADADGAVKIGTSRLFGDALSGLAPGEFVQVSGRPSGNGIEVEAVDAGLYDNPVQVSLIEGYFSPARGDNGLYTVYGSGLIAYTENPQMLDILTRTRMCGVDGQLVTDADQDSVPAHLHKTLERLNCR